MSEYSDRQADWTKREQERTVKVGEGRGKVTGDIKKTDDVKIKIDKVGTLTFKPSMDLKKGDSIRVTMERV